MSSEAATTEEAPKREVPRFTLFTGQWADLPIAELAPQAREMGYDSLELACWGDHMDVVKAAGPDGQAYCDGQKKILTDAGLKPPYAISHHLAGQNVGDKIDARHLQWAGDECRAAYVEWRKEHDPPEDDPYFVPDEVVRITRKWAMDQMMCAVVAAERIGAEVINGFVGSPVAWRQLLYSFPPNVDAIGDVKLPDPFEVGMGVLRERWYPFLDACKEKGKRFGLEVHPTEEGCDLFTAKLVYAGFNHPAFGFNFDPSHLLWQLVDPVVFLEEVHALAPDDSPIVHTHMKDVRVDLVPGRAGILGFKAPFGGIYRRWGFVSVGYGNVNFPEVLRMLRAIGYDGPLSVEWEHQGMDRIFGATDSVQRLRRMWYPDSGQAFDAAFER